MIPVAAEGSALDTTPGTGKTGKAQRKIAVAAPLIRKHMPFFSSTRYPRVLPAEMPAGGTGVHLRRDCRCPPMIQRLERQTLNVYRLFRYVHPEITEIPAASA